MGTRPLLAVCFSVDESDETASVYRAIALDPHTGAQLAQSRPVSMPVIAPDTILAQNFWDAQFANVGIDGRLYIFNWYSRYPPTEPLAVSLWASLDSDYSKWDTEDWKIGPYLRLPTGDYEMGGGLLTEHGLFVGRVDWDSWRYPDHQNYYLSFWKFDPDSTSTKMLPKQAHYFEGDQDDEVEPDSAFWWNGKLCFSTEAARLATFDPATSYVDTVFDLNDGDGDTDNTDLDICAAIFRPLNRRFYVVGLRNTSFGGYLAGHTAGIVSGPPGAKGPPPDGGMKIEHTWVWGIDRNFGSSATLIEPYMFFSGRHHICRYNLNTDQLDLTWWDDGDVGGDTNLVAPVVVNSANAPGVLTGSIADRVVSFD